MCLLLADFLRDTLLLGAAQRISLREELNIVERYLSIEQVRLGARLNVFKETSPQALSAKVPALILQPLAENAVLHGIAHMLEGGTVTIRAQREHSMLIVWVTNPCDPDRPRQKRTGFGLSLVRQRLQSQFGLAGQLETGEERGEFTAKLSLPFESADGVIANAYA
jgi:two-component system, LytTR family, sensor histidine kinase AlgZ